MALDRRTFCQLSAGTLIATSSQTLLGDVTTPAIADLGSRLRVECPKYTWEYSASDDTFRLFDSHKREIVSGTVQPSVVVAPVANPTDRRSTPGKVLRKYAEKNRAIVEYEGVNNGASLVVTWRFDERGIWLLPVIYKSPSPEDIVSLHYFSKSLDGVRQPSLHATYLVVPGISEGSSISPIVRDDVHLDQQVWLGRGSFIPGLSQQWGLPVHYFCGFSVDSSNGLRQIFTEGRSDAFACGLADLPNGDLFLTLNEGSCSPSVDYRSDLWKHLRTPGELSLGATFLWSVAPDYYQAIAAHYRNLLDAGIVTMHRNSQLKTQIALTPQFCTWGSQVDENKLQEHLDEAFLENTYDSLKASGLKAGLFSIDDKWEEAYGNLQHSASRFPHFEQFLDKLRAEGYRVGIWAALMRCERPADLGLTEDNMLKRPDGTPYVATNFGSSHYYILDFTQPAVAEVLRALVKRFVRRYKPDLFKFDFGYELPPAADAAPQDKQWAGERLLLKGLDVVIKAMREENPDLVVMYYQLSPLFLEYFDLHSTDDLFLAAGEYAFEANRRIFFSSLLGTLGIPTYGSSGYDWSSAPSIWFDSAAAGTIGSLNDFHADEQGESGSAAIIAKYNGIAKALRKTCIFEVVPFGTIAEAPTFGAHARSWARYEDGQLVLIAYRPPELNGDYAAGPHRTDPIGASAVHSSVPVIVAARGSASILRDAELAIVPYGSGSITLRRDSGSSARMIRHYFGGATSNDEVQIMNGNLTLDVSDRDAAGRPLEWIEVHIS